ncbi:MAG: pyridoxal phosphate-dependent aminotransferase [Propionibacteriaceae bacterium]|jgi:aspartate/methionine/tyrosine aminotransferase|nr:pyridoxal phosphate-dependent aminotransferase [Propionibacteriaceae bacterium]
MVADRWTAPGPVNQWSRRRAELGAAGVELIDLTDTNPTHFGLECPQVAPALARAAQATRRYDPSPRGPRAARRALADRYGGGPDDYWLTSSTSEAYGWLFALLADPGQQVAAPAPGYPLIEPLARHAGLSVQTYPSHYLHPYGWWLDRDRFEAVAAQPRTRLVTAVSPGNPTGAYLDPAELRHLAQVCQRRRLPLIVDQVFAPYDLDRTDPTGPTDWDGLGPTVTFVLDGVSKLLCAPGLKLAWIRLGGPARLKAELAAALDQVADTFLPVAGATAAALPDLLAAADQQVAATRRRLAANLARAAADLAGDRVRLRRVEGGWIALIDVNWAGPPDLALALLERHRLAVHPGWFYDLVEPGCLALSLLPEPDRFAVHCRDLRQALESLKEVFDGVPNRP